jgi:hypothetical protein
MDIIRWVISINEGCVLLTWYDVAIVKSIHGEHGQHDEEADEDEEHMARLVGRHPFCSKEAIAQLSAQFILAGYGRGRGGEK